MLVLSRKQNQEIKIGDEVTVTVLKVKGNTVRLGIQAPRNVRVVRGELPKLEEAQPKMAEVTIVFNNSNEKLGDDCVDVVPFQPQAKSRDRQEDSNQQSSNRISESNSTSSRTSQSKTTREPLPPSLSTNRLREILAEISGQ